MTYTFQENLSFISQMKLKSIYEGLYDQDNAKPTIMFVDFMCTFPI